MKVGHISNQVALGKRRNHNLSSFCSTQSVASQNKTSINSMPQSNFLSNVSFAGYTRKFTVYRHDHYDNKREVTYPVYHGTSGAILKGYEKRTELGPITRTDYVVKGARGEKIECSDPNAGVYSAILNSPDYKGGYIDQNKSVVLYPRDPHSYNQTAPSTAAKVYFADKDEKVYPDKIKDYNYVVYASGSYLAPFDNHIDETNYYDEDNSIGVDGLGWSWT